MKKKATIILGITFMLLTSFAHADDVRQTIIKTGTGGPTGNYFAMGNDVKSYCDESLENASLEIMNTGGSVENILGINNKKFSLIITQKDVLQYFAKKDPKRVNRNRMKIVTGLHNETAHLLIPNGYKPKGKSKKVLGACFQKSVLVEMILQKVFPLISSKTKQLVLGEEAW